MLKVPVELLRTLIGASPQATLEQALISYLYPHGECMDMTRAAWLGERLVHMLVESARRETGWQKRENQPPRRRIVRSKP